ncbi:MAG TPA: phytoene desaturase family protein [Mycobacteriales bacterium]|nr:phytoene desaturase family protein [Mycobacteriales bacterium]
MRIAVIGAGVGGLAAACLLAGKGHEVTVCEQAPAVGGKLGWREIDGVGFDTGPSLLTLPHILREVFEQAGGWPESLVLQRLEPIARYRFADGSGFDVSSDLDTFCAALDAWAPGSGHDWRRFMSHASRLWQAVRGPFLESELRGPSTLVELALRRPRDLATIAPWRTLADLGQRYLRDPRLRAFLWRYATYTGSDPRRVPAALATIAFAEQHYGGWYVRGGLRLIAAELAARAIDLGAEIRLGTEVIGVVTAGERAGGVHLSSGERLGADAVVCNADAAQLYAELLPGSIGRAGRQQLSRVSPSYSGFALLLAIRGSRPADLAHHTVLFPADYPAEFDDLAAGRPVAEPAIYLSAPVDAALAPAGLLPMFLLVNAPRQDQCEWTAEWSHEYAARLLDRLATRGLDLRDRLASCTMRTPADLQQATRAPGGSIYGSSSNGLRAAFLRPRNRGPIPGLYLVGGSSHPGGGLPLVLRSAQIVSRMIDSGAG